MGFLGKKEAICTREGSVREASRLMESVTGRKGGKSVGAEREVGPQCRLSGVLS